MGSSTKQFKIGGEVANSVPDPTQGDHIVNKAYFDANASTGGDNSHEEDSYTWNTADPNTFTVADSAKVTDIYLNGKRLEKFEEDGVTPDEWRVNTATEIEILIELNDADKVTIVRSSTVVVTSGGGGTEEIPFTPVVKLDNKYVSEHSISGAIHYTFDNTGAILAMTRTDYLVADGINKPTFDTNVFTIRYDGYSNTLNQRNRIYFEYAGNDKIMVDIVYV